MAAKRGISMGGAIKGGKAPARDAKEDAKIANRPDVKRMTVLLDPDDYRRLAVHAAQTGTKKYELLEDAVKDYLKKVGA